MNIKEYLQQFANSFNGQDYTSTIGAGSLGLQGIESTANKFTNKQKADWFRKDARRNTFIGGIAIPALLGAHTYTFGPMYNTAIKSTVADQAAQGGAAGTLILGDMGLASLGITELLDKLSKNSQRKNGK